MSTDAGRHCIAWYAQEKAEERAWQKLLEVANLLIVPHSNASSTPLETVKRHRGSTGGDTSGNTVAYPTIEALKAALTPPGGQPPRLLRPADSNDTAPHPTEVGGAGRSDGDDAAAAQLSTVGAGLFRIEINLSSSLAGIVAETALAEQLQLSKTSTTAARPMFALVGDAAVTAHYRLGVVRLCPTAFHS
eukprot:COSAG02_NODE_2387_length_8986_cov_12.395184_2_plen_190_part_00